MTVDWSQPIEAVHEDGRKSAVTAWERADGNLHAMWSSQGLFCQGAFDPSGKPVADWPWRIRNFAEAELPGNSDQLPPELVARMAALVREMTQGPKHLEGPWSREARAILALLPQPAVADLVEARAIASDVSGHDVDFASAIRTGTEDDCSEVRSALAALRRGRQLEREGR